MVDKERIEVDAKALMHVLHALEGPPHYIAELQATRRLDDLLKTRNPINVLIYEYKAWHEKYHEANG